MKLGLCVLMAVVIAIFFAYLAGVRIANERCRARINTDGFVRQSEIIKLQGDVNVEVFNRGVDDIRRVLREKYTIVE